MTNEIRIEKRGRNFAVIDVNDELICIAEYRIGAETVKAMITELRHQVAERAALIIRMESDAKWLRSQLNAAEEARES